MSATYKVHHSRHVNVAGAQTQRPHFVALSSKGSGCEMQVQTIYSRWNHTDAGDFKKRVEESLAKPNGLRPSEPAQPADATK